jgi:hypothetical protein
MKQKLPFVWGATEAECAARYPCDRLVSEPDHRFVRAIDVDAPASVMFRWLQQLRIAPYSYDWADNFLLPSPGRLTPRAETIAIGQRMMHLFVIREIEPGRSITLGPASRLGEALFGTLYGTYVVIERGPQSSRLLVVVNARYPRTPLWKPLRGVMPWIDFLMMRKQLQRLAAFAERDRWKTSAGKLK